MGDETPCIVVPSPFGELTVTAHAHSYPHQVEINVKGQHGVDFDDQQFTIFTAYFALSEGALRSRTVTVYQRHDDGRLLPRSLPSATRKKFQAKLKQVLLAQRPDLLQLEMAVLEQAEEKLELKKQALIGLGAKASPPAADEPSVLADLLGDALDS